MSSSPRQLPPKPFKTYSDLVALLQSRGIEIADCARAERKLSQIGYYRLSGFWYSCRELLIDASGKPVVDQLTRKPRRLDSFMPGTSLEGVLELYLFDKRLRLSILDAIERIEVHLRTVIAHELGRIDPIAHEQASFINPRDLQDYVNRKTGKIQNSWRDWQAEHEKQLARCSEDCILWHKTNNKIMPFWVVVEAWSFGLASRYYGLLKRRHQRSICLRFGIDNPSVLGAWLRGINDFRNRCAHHSRIWNYACKNRLPTLPEDAFMEHWINSPAAMQRLYGMAVVIARLMTTIGPNSSWFRDFATVLDSKPHLPGCDFTAVGLPDSEGFPHHLFSES